jgi:hypothetical protein
MGQAWGGKYSFHECLYTLWQCTDHVVTFVFPKNKSGTTYLTTSHNHNHNINNAVSSLCPHQRPHKPTNTMQASQMTPVCRLGRVFCFIHLLLFLLNVFYFVLGSIL